MDIILHTAAQLVEYVRIITLLVRQVAILITSVDLLLREVQTTIITTHNLLQATQEVPILHPHPQVLETIIHRGAIVIPVLLVAHVEGRI